MTAIQVLVQDEDTYIDPLESLDVSKRPAGVSYFFATEIIPGHPELDDQVEADMRLRLTQGWRHVPAARHPEVGRAHERPAWAPEDAVRCNGMVLLERAPPRRKTAEEQVADILAANGMASAEITTEIVRHKADGTVEVFPDRVTISRNAAAADTANWHRIGTFKVGQ